MHTKFQFRYYPLLLISLSILFSIPANAQVKVFTHNESCLTVGEELEITMSAILDDNEQPVEGYFVVEEDSGVLFTSQYFIAIPGSGIADKAFINIGDASQLTVKFIKASNHSILGTDILSVQWKPEYQIDKAVYQCDGQMSTFVEIISSDQTIEVLWEDGSNSLIRDDLDPGIYQCTLSYPTGCSEVLKINLDEESELEIKTDAYTIDCNGQNKDITKLTLLGGYGPFTVSMPDGSSYLINDELVIEDLNSGNHMINIIDRFGCSKEYDVAIYFLAGINLQANDAAIVPRSNIDGKMNYNLIDAESPAFGDVDGDGNEGATFPTTYYLTESDAIQEINELPIKLEVGAPISIFAKVKSSLECYEMAEVQLMSMPIPTKEDFLNGVDEICDHEDPRELVLDAGTFPSGGVFSFLGCILCENQEDPILYDDINDVYKFDPAVGRGIYSIVYTYDDAGTMVSVYDDIAVQALIFAFSPEVGSVCGGLPPIKIDKVPTLGGIVSGTGVVYDPMTQDYYFDSNNLDPGTYSLSYTYGGDFASGYECPTTVFQEVILLEQPGIEVVADASQSCVGSEINLIASTSGSASITNIEWVGPNGFMSNDETIIIDATDIEQTGDYTVTVTDSQGCFASDTENITIFALPEIDCNITAGVSCSGAEDAVAIVEIISGQPPFSYLWSTGDTEETLENIPAGEYVLEVTDGHGCTVECQVNITEPDPLELQASAISNVTCFGGEDGAAQVTVEGGTPFMNGEPYLFEWTNGVTTASNNSLEAGRNYVTVTDANGCSTVEFVDLTEPPGLNIEIDNQEFCLDFTHQINSIIEGGTGNYSNFQWYLSDPGTTGVIDDNILVDNQQNLRLNTIGLSPGTISIGFRAMDSNGCEIEDFFDLEIVHCFDLAIRKTAEEFDLLYPGDTVLFHITVFNQGEVDAYDLVIEDEVPDGLIFTPSINQTSETNNPHDWTIENGLIVTKIDFLEPGDSFKLYTNLIISEDFEGNVIENVARIISSSNGEVDDPQDEDDAADEDNETDNEIDDDSIGGMDNPEDEDKSDFEDIDICQTKANPLELRECVQNFENGTACFDISLPDVLDHIDGNGDGDGDSGDGDSGARITCHQTLDDAEKGENQMDELICTTDRIIYARVTEQNGCFAVSELRLDVVQLQPVQDEPDDVNVILESSAQFCVTAGDADYTLQWQEYLSGQWIDMVGETSQCIYFPIVYLTDDDRLFRVLIEGVIDGEMCQIYSRETLLKTGCAPSACNDHINLSINNTCSVTVTPDMVTEGPLSATVEVNIIDQYGNEYGDQVGPHLWGQLLTVEVFETCDGSKCWGTLTVEDKYINPIVCEDITLECNDPIEPGVIAPFPSLVDYDISLQSDGSYLAVREEICDTVFLTYHDDFEVLTCHEELSRIITRHWYASDPYGNDTECVQTISIERIFIGDITPPSSYDGFDEEAFYCDDDLNLDNVPGPTWNGMDIPDLCHNFNIIYDDTRFDICPESYKIHREWTLIDWCTQEILVYEQIIKVEPREPICKEPRNLETVTSGYECAADYKVPAPEFDNPCNIPYTYTVRWASFNEALQVFNQPTALGITGNQYSGYTINGLPQGKSRIYYRIEDACNKVTNCYDNVTVKDETSPNAIGKEFITATLGITAWTRVYAESVNEGSHDNCAIEKIEVARMDDLCYPQNTLVFRDFVEFCCADVGNMAMVVMRVTDTSGNTSEVMVEVQVQNKIIPDLECPGTYVVECTDNVPTPDVSGWPVATNVDAFCPQFLIEYNDNVSLNDCGIGSINRHFYYRDGETGEILVDCYQTINVVDSNPFDENDIDWPSNTELTGCLYDLDPESPNSPVHGPDISDQQCALIAVEYSDQVFEDVAVACGKVLRTWTVIDWCQFEAEFPDVDPNQNGVQDGIWSQTQTIALYNNQAPKITNCSSSKIFIPGYGECEESVTMTREATDDCVDPELLTWSYEIDLGNDGSFEPSYSGSSNTFTRTLPFGEHRVVWIVSDPCNNRDICEEVFEVYDDKAPTPVCLSEVVTVVLGEDNHVEIWAVDFEASSYDNCSEYLYYSFSQNVNDDRRSFDCTDIPEGMTEIEIPLQMWVTDGAGLQDFCIVTMVLQNNNVEECDYTLTGTDVSGRVSTEMEEMMENVKVELLDNSGVMIMEGQTDAEGNYAFNDVPMYNDYTLSAEKNDDVLNGVSTLDIVLMQKHVLGVKALDSPYKLLAADVDGNQTVSAIDLINLRKVILGIVEYFPNDVESWMFIDANIQFEDPNQPWYQNYMPTMSDIESNSFGKNLMGIKVGDVNNSVVANMTSNVNIENRSSKKMLVGFDHDATEEKKIPVYIDSESAISGFQFNLTLGQAVGSVKVLPGSLILNQNNYNYTDNGLTISHSTAVGIRISEDEPAFYIQYSGIWDSNIELTSHIIVAEAYDDDLNIMAVELRDSGLETNELMSEFSVTLSPNPVVDFAIIDFETAYSGQMSLNIFNQTGQRVYETIISHEGGQAQLSVNTTDMSAGLYFYELRAGVEVYKSKMLIMK